MKCLSCVRLFVTPWTIAHQAPLSMEFSRQEYWSGLPFPSPGDLPYPGLKPRSPALQADTWPSEPPGNVLNFSKTGTNRNINNRNYHYWIHIPGNRCYERHSIHLISFTPLHNSMKHPYHHLVDDYSGSKRLSNLPMFTQLIQGRTWIHICGWLSSKCRFLISKPHWWIFSSTRRGLQNSAHCKF